jgi:hypothetical protein
MVDCWRRVEVGFTVVVAFATVTLGITSYFQYDSARKAARRATQANRIAKEALTQAQKAFVFVSGIDMQRKAVPPELIRTANAEIVISVINSGNTPARRVLFTANDMFDATENFDYPDFIPSNKFPMFLGPKQLVQMQISLSYLSALSIREGYMQLKVYGHIEYLDDILHADHRTWFCFNYLPHLIAPRQIGGGEDVFSACLEHNCMDSDCPEPWDYRPRISAPIFNNAEVEIPRTATPTPEATVAPLIIQIVRLSRAPAATR